MTQLGLFELHKRPLRLHKTGDPLVELNRLVDREQFRELIEFDREMPRKFPAGAKSYDSSSALQDVDIAVVSYPFRRGNGIPDLGSLLVSLRFARVPRRQCHDNLPFSRGIDVGHNRRNPLCTVCPFLKDNGFRAQKGQIIDVNLIRSPVQRNVMEENEAIKQGKPVKSWIKKKGVSSFGY